MIGSNDCTVDLFTIRVYDNDLTRYQILDNFIADSTTYEELIDRYQHNDIFDDYDNIVIEMLPADLPYLIITCPQLPQYKGDKKIVTITYVDPADITRNYTAFEVQLDVQGTSSQYYPRKNYKAKYKNGFTLTDSTVIAKRPLREGGMPFSTYCYKADVASSEGANNVELVRLYNNACPYKTPAQVSDSRVRQGIDGLPIVIFWHDTTNNTTSFIGKYNENIDKSAEEVFGFEDGDESWEIRNNTSNRVIWKSADFSGSDWLNDFEARYPDTDPAYEDSTQLAEFAAWLVSTDTTAATNETLASPVTYDGTQYRQCHLQVS